MERSIQDLPAILGRFLIFGPLLYLGLHILLHPGALAEVLNSAMDGIERFSAALRGHQHWPPSRRLDRRAPATLAALRWFGLALIVYCIVCLYGLGRPPN